MNPCPSLCTMALIGVSFLSAPLIAQSGMAWIDQNPSAAGLQNWKLSDYFTSKVGTGQTKTMGDITSPAPIWTAPGGALLQVSTGKTGIAGLTAGEFHMCLTTSNLSPFYGALSQRGQVIMGKVSWPAGKPVFVPNTMANNMNSGRFTGNVFGLMIDDKDGLVAAVDWPRYPVVSKRTSNAVPFPRPVQVAGVGGHHPAPGYVDGQLVLFWVDYPGNNIVYAPLTIQTVNGQLNASVGAKVVAISIPGRICHSPTPLCDANGEVLGMWFGSGIGADSDMYFTPTIKSPTPTQEWDNGTSWINSGGIAGGRVLAASIDADGYYGRLLEGQGYHMVANSDIQVGASARLTLKVGAQSSNAVPVVISQIAVSLKTIASVPLPGILGEFALDPALMLFPVLPWISSSTADDFGQMQLPASAPSLKGNNLMFQALSLPLAPLSPAFTNTLQVRFL